MIASFRFTGQSAAMTATDLDQLVAQTCRNLDKESASASDDDETFAEKITRAVREKTARHVNTRKATENSR